jgi:regulator of sigma E protease
MSSIFVILIISFLVIIHELGHFIAAKWSKVKVDEFGIGYPPKAFRLFRWKGTDFTINWIPFGGFVRMQGEEGKTEKTDLKGQFYQTSVFRKLVIILSGAAVNFIFGVLAFAIVFSKMGIPEIIPDARIGEVSSGSPAEQSGMSANANIIGFQLVDGNKVNINSVEDIIKQISDNKGKTVKIFTSGSCEALSCEEIEREFEVYLRTDEETPPNQGSLGIVFNQIVYTHYSAWEMPLKSVSYGLEQAMYLGEQIVQAFSGIVVDIFTKGKVSGDVSGPVGIVHQAQSFGIMDGGFLTLLSFAGMLSINLAVMNVLPLPPLDGGRALFIMLELIFKKKRIQKIEGYLNYGGYIFLLGLIVFITFKDILRIFGR